LNSWYQHQLTNYSCITDIYLYFILKYGGWSIHYCQRYSIYLRYYIWISFYRRYNNVTGPSASLRALNFILFDISLVYIFLTHHFWVYDYISFRFLSASFWISSRLYSSWISSVACCGRENKVLWLWNLDFEMIRVNPINFISFSMRAVYFNILLKGCIGVGLYRSQA